MVDLSLIENKAINREIMEMLSNHMDLLTGRLGTIKTLLNKIDLKEETRHIYKQHCCAEQISRDVLHDHITKHLEAGVIIPAQSEWVNPIVMVPD